MFQSFEAATRPQDGPLRLTALRSELETAGLAGFLVPRGDRFQGEYVAAADERLAWLTGFTGSAGFAAVLTEIAGVFVDGRYRLQVRSQTAQDVYTPVDWPEVKLADWLIEHLPSGGTVGFDPWLHTADDITGLEKRLRPNQIALRPVENPIDRIWEDRPEPPMAPVSDWPVEFAGLSAEEKLAGVVEDLTEAGDDVVVLTQPDSLCWLLNIRGGDVGHTPLVHGMAIVQRDGALTLFAEPGKFADLVLPDGVDVQPEAEFEAALMTIAGRVRIDPKTTPFAVQRALEDGPAEVVTGPDPCVLPKAKKHPAEIAATKVAHIRDGAAMARFLHWFERTAPDGGLTEIDCAKALEGFRAETGALKDISFDSIVGAGPNGAIVHYRVTEETNAPVKLGQLFLIDSGAQYLDGTTDVTRTLPVDDVDDEERTAFTLVLRGMIAIHLARFPKGVAGAHLDALARAPLWAAGWDYDHGTGHGVGVFLGVHEGPQRLSRASNVPLEPGMILSNEPGYYREGAFGIRIENLVHVVDAPALPGADDRAMLAFETLTYVPIDRRLILTDDLTRAERDWLNSYHRDVLEKIGPELSGNDALWLKQACAPI